MGTPLETYKRAPASIKKFVLTFVQNMASELISSTKATFILLYGGSRSGKTALIIALIFLRASRYQGSRHLVARFRFNHAKTSLWYDTMPKVARLIGMKRKMVWNKADWFIKVGESEIWLAGLDDKERLEKVLGNEYATIYLNEASQISYLALTTLMSRLAQKIDGLKNRIFIDCNPPTKRHWIYNLFILKRDPESRLPLKRPENYVSMLMNPADNLDNISDEYLDLLEDMPERQRKRFKLGVFLDDVEGALFKQDEIDRCREAFAHNLVKIAVAIDPAVSKKDASDKTGIIVGGVDDRTMKDGKPRPHGYVLEDRSGKYSPDEWADLAIALYHEYNADCIVAEVNNGGDMVRHIIENKDPNIKVYTVHATKGKMVRAEPISAIAEQGRLHMVGPSPFVDLEEQMTTFTGKTGEPSPDNFDAMIWLFTHLMIGSKQETTTGPATSGN